MVRQYLDLLQHILDNGVRKRNRTGVDTIAVFGYQNRYDLSQGFPLLTTKRMFTKGIFAELLWFLRGETNIKPLVDQGVHIWTPDAYRSNAKHPEVATLSLEEYSECIKQDAGFAQRYGELGPVYGKQWRDFGGVDQIADLESALRESPESRRHIVSAWNPPEVTRVALPPCHVLFQFDVTDGKLSCNMYQRSADAFLGVPFNIASYATLTAMLAQTAGLQPGEFIHSFGDLHIYANHEEAVRTQLAREPRQAPYLALNKQRKSVFDFTLDDFRIEGYHPHPAIKAELNVGLPSGGKK